jgi:hypothetical protein
MLSKQPDQNIYATECVPEGFVLSDPDHLTSSQINSLYNHWLDRQNQGLEPFIIRNPNPSHRRKVKKVPKAKGKGKEKASWVDVKTDDEDVGSELDDAVISPATKIGPPTKKTKRKDYPNAIAGSSKLPPTSPLPPVNKASKKDLPTEHPTKKTKKRKADDDLGGRPEKLANTKGFKSKRQMDEPAESPVATKKAKLS